PRYGRAARLLITADSGGSNSCRGRLWKVSLQRLADEAGFDGGVRHYPPGTSKGKRGEHGAVSLIGVKWRGRPPRGAATLAGGSGRGPACGWRRSWTRGPTPRAYGSGGRSSRGSGGGRPSSTGSGTTPSPRPAALSELVTLIPGQALTSCAAPPEGAGPAPM